MRKIVFSLFFAISLNCSAEVLGIEEIIAYSGTIANSNVFLTLSYQDDQVAGNYFYEKYKAPIALHGNTSGTSLLLIEETMNGDAYIDLENKGGVISGEWALGRKRYKVQAKALSRSYKDLIGEIKVVAQGGADKNLVISFAGGKRQNIRFSTLESSVLIVFEDFTFDGYPDLRILELEAGGNSSFIYFDYDVEAGQYVESSAELRALVSPRVIHSENVIISVSKDGCCVYQVKKIMPSETHLARYDFDSNAGSLSIISRAGKDRSRKPITEKQFKDGYLNYMSHGVQPD